MERGQFLGVGDYEGVEIRRFLWKARGGGCEGIVGDKVENLRRIGVLYRRGVLRWIGIYYSNHYH